MVSSRHPPHDSTHGNGSAPPRRWRAIISDIHANYEALTAVLADIETQGIKEICCLGDVVGYGPSPVICLKTIRAYTTWCLYGNHDLAVLTGHALGFRPDAVRAVDFHRRNLIPSFWSLPSRVARWRWLENLCPSRSEGNIRYVHASPRDPIMEYVLAQDFDSVDGGPTQKAVEMFEHVDRACFVGHSHRPGIATHEYQWIVPEELDDGTYELPKDKKTIVNIGSVGQPRDRDERSCYVLFDGDTIKFRRVTYDLKTTQERIRSIPDLDERLAKRLELGM